MAGVPVEQLVRRLEPDEQPSLAYARSIVEYCSYVALRAETRRRHDHLGDREFHSLTYDMMLAWEAPDHDTEAELQVCHLCVRVQRDRSSTLSDGSVIVENGVQLGRRRR